VSLQRGTGWPSGPSLPTIFRALLLCPALVMARRETSHAVYQLCVGLADTPVTPKPAAFFEELLLAQLKDIADPEGACVFVCNLVFACMCLCQGLRVPLHVCTGSCLCMLEFPSTRGTHMCLRSLGMTCTPLCAACPGVAHPTHFVAQNLWLVPAL
jgi:hypothetical protein